MSHIHTRSDFDDRCKCGHTRGEHLISSRGSHERCLIVGCHCAGFEREEPEEKRAKAATQD